MNAGHGGYWTTGHREANAGNIGEILKQIINSDAQLGVILKLIENNEQLQRRVAHVFHKQIVLQKPINEQKEYHELIGAGNGCGN